MRIFTAAEMKRAEAEAVKRGTSYERLMENAGEGAAHTIIQLAEKNTKPHSVLFLCGRGNNAGDAFVAARILAGCGWSVQLLMLADGPFSELAALNYSRLPKSVAVVESPDACPGVGVLCDGVFGTGFHGQLPAPIAKGMAAACNASPEALRASLDMPSGLNCDTGEVSPGCFLSNHTITFGAYKPALLMPQARPWYNEVICIDIGL